MAKITGVGGVFIHQPYDVQKLLEWYRDTLGIQISKYGLNFLEPNQFTLVTFDNKEQTFLNFTVDNLDEMMDSLREKNVTIVSEIKEYSYGKFAQIKDCFGGTVELWEPYESGYLELAKKEMMLNENS